MTKQLLALAAAAGLLACAGTSVLAQSSMTPGHQYQEKGSMKGSPGASGYAPGHKMQRKGPVRGTTGASGYAPGHAGGNAGGGNENGASKGR